ncbi:Hsp20/alpha crystallin family protein [Ferruginivarius sediminum]|uniref:Hsp20/alpha crystallin family protein n=1 Tax=Ferruginivarius sediminum TaxID=2661937 RepID=A0A369TCU6_9PROT|nr:Hsp20/alpha crystallin family protein [Ferruginivarius sediminum]RDD62642.1 Hsp20/alpha crystallin family protein [Ferruginivarius sediminum]
MAEKSKEEKGGAPTTTGGLDHPMMEFRRQMDRLVDDFSNYFRMPSLGSFGRMPAEPEIFGGTAGLVDVKFDVSESDKEIEIAAEAPGMEEKDIDVEVSAGILTIKGEKKHEEEKKEKNYYLSERRFGSFRRSFRLPDSVDEDKISAEFEKGVLKVTLSKKPEAVSKAKKIEVKGK